MHACMRGFCSLGSLRPCTTQLRPCVQVHVYPLDHPKAVAAVTATHTIKVAEGQQSRKERRKATYSPRSAQSVAV